jgi:hypothetical protein
MGNKIKGKALYPEVCPIRKHPAFNCDPKECPKDYRWCSKFSSWFWHKATQDNEPITEEKIPAEIRERIWGNGREHGIKMICEVISERIKDARKRGIHPEIIIGNVEEDINKVL